MATLALAAVGSAIGSAVLPAGFSVLGATVTGATIGTQLGAFAGSYVDQALFGASGDNRVVDGPRLSELHVTSSTEGAPIPKVYGRVRMGGQVIWATAFEEEATTTSAGGGGKGLGSSGSAGGSRRDYAYYGNFAVAVAEGPISAIGRVWADGRELNLSQVTYRVHKGDAAQLPDSLIEAREGAGKAPAYRGIAYIVFERLALGEFGNRLPQLSFEVYRSVEPFGEKVKGVVLIPGSGEFVYATRPVVQRLGGGESRSENVHTRQADTDWTAALDQMQTELPNVAAVSLVVSWFGTDLRAGHCQIRPGVERREKDNGSNTWRGGGVSRASALLVSERDGRPAYGGTPADFAVIEGLRDLKTRGLSVTMTPFVLMDVPAGNALPDPYGGAAQPAYPWRGRITVSPAPGEVGTPDLTATAATDIAAFVGTAGVTDFTISGETVAYFGPNEWSYRRMVLHQAHLAKAAGGVDAFLLGTELRGLTWVRDGQGSYPFVDALVTLAADVRAIVGPATKISYAADWSEYFGHQPSDGSGDAYFHLDALWASPDVDAVAIDCYWPLSDWRDEAVHADRQAGARSVYELAYLRGNVRGGEGFDWYYADAADRDAQVRRPITDGQGKPWVFRTKDLQAWWGNAHYNRPGGVEAGLPTAWVPESKPVWLMEIGCPAVDKGANQPNVFVDPKSAESNLPYFSKGNRDDLMQRRYLEALIGAFDPAEPDFDASVNPVSSVYAGRMIDTADVFVYCWDARPYPAFPHNLDVWGDGDNWRLGHWLSGRFTGVPLGRLVETVLRDFAFDAADTETLFGTVPGYVIDRPMAAREALQPLSLAFFFDAIETGGRIAFRHRGAAPPVLILNDDAVVEDAADQPLAVFTRGQETELPASAKVSYISTVADYQKAVSEARRLVGASGRLSQADLPMVLESEQAQQIAESWLFEAWASRERAGFKVPPSALALEPGDVVRYVRPDHDAILRITEIGDAGAREISARSIDPDIYGAPPAPERQATDSQPVAVGTPIGRLLNLPLLSGDEPPRAGYFAATQMPWPGGVALYSSPTTSGFQVRAVAGQAAIMGETLSVLPPGPAGRIDHGTELKVVVSGELQSVMQLQMFAGGNVCAVTSGDGAWEIIQFERADLVAPKTYALRGLLRGQAGTEHAMRDARAPGQAFVLINQAVAQIEVASSELNLPLEWRYGPSNRDLGHASYQGVTHAFTAVGLKPLAPVHVRGQRGQDALEVTWVRRTRVGGDTWEAPDVPLGEDVERYEIDVLASNGSIVRTASVTTPVWQYSTALELADFGSVGGPIVVAVYQISGQVGRGTGATAELSL